MLGQKDFIEIVHRTSCTHLEVSTAHVTRPIIHIPNASVKMSATEPTGTARCQRFIKMMLMAHHFLNFLTGRGCGRCASEDWAWLRTWARPHDESDGFIGVLSRIWLPPESTGPGQPSLDFGSPPAGWFPLPDAVAGAHPSASL